MRGNRKRYLALVLEGPGEYGPGGDGAETGEDCPDQAQVRWSAKQQPLKARKKESVKA